MTLKKSSILILIILIISAIFFFNNSTKENYITLCGTYAKKEILIGDKIIKVDIADNDCKRELGLSGKEQLKDDEGMVFIFDKVGNYGFWMKDMKFPIDILWLNDYFEVVGIEKDLATSTFPEAFGQNYLSKYVLEVPSGFSNKNNINIGNKFIFSEKIL